jgi:hypothetical protein
MAATNPFETENPFPVIAPGTPSAARATVPDQAPVTNVSAPDQASVTNVAAPTMASTREAQAQQATARGYTASTATNERAQATLRQVQPNELVQNQLAQIVGDDSILLQRARARANEQSNARGLVNSSMALGAADAAVYDYAMPIARDDAAAYGTAARDNQQFENSTSQFNAGEANTTARSNAGLISRASEFGADADNTASRTNAELGTRVSETNARESNLSSRQNVDLSFTAGRDNAAAANRASLQTNDQTFRASQDNAAAANRAAIQTNDQMFQASEFDAREQNAMTRQTNDQQFRAAVENSSVQTQAAMNRFTTDLAAERDSTAAGSEIFRQFQVSATNILASDMPQEAKDRAIDELVQLTRQSMLASRSMDEARIDEILTMPRLTRPASATAPASTADPESAPGGAAPGGAAPGDMRPGVDDWRYGNNTA